MLNYGAHLHKQFPYLQFCSSHLPIDWLFLREIALMFSGSLLQKRLLFYIEEGMRLDSQQALAFLRPIAFAIQSLAKQESVDPSIKNKLSSILC